MADKIRIRLGRLVDRPIFMMDNNRPTVIGYEFIAALEKLCADEMPIRERYAAGKTLAEAKELAGLYAKRVGEVRDKLGKKQSEVLKEAIANNTERAVAIPLLAKVVEKDKEHLLQLELSPALDTVIIPQEKIAEYTAQVEAIHAEDIVFAYLDHRIPLSNDSKLTGKELEVLDDIVALP